MTGEVGAAYSSRAQEYIDHLGSIASVHPSDLELVARWADQLDGPLIDAGCGPGHWTGHLAARGADVRGVDQVPEFVSHARRAHPGCRFEVGDLDALPRSPGAVAGILAGAYRWSVEALSEELRMADFEVIETYTRTGPGARPHGAIVARLMSAHDGRAE